MTLILAHTCLIVTVFVHGLTPQAGSTPAPTLQLVESIPIRSGITKEAYSNRDGTQVLLLRISRDRKQSRIIKCDRTENSVETLSADVDLSSFDVKGNRLLVATGAPSPKPTQPTARSTLTCIDLRTGKRLYRELRFGKGIGGITAVPGTDSALVVYGSVGTAAHTNTIDSNRGMIGAMSIDNGKESSRFRHEDAVTIPRLSVSGDGRWIASCSGTIVVWDSRGFRKRGSLIADSDSGFDACIVGSKSVVGFELVKQSTTRISVYSIEPLDRLRTFVIPYPVSNHIFLSGGVSFACLAKLDHHKQVLLIIDLRTGVATEVKGVNCHHFSVDSTCRTMCCSDVNRVRIYNLSSP